MRFASRMMGPSAILVLAFATITFGQMEIPEGSATIDGDLSDWAGATWIDVDQIYYSSEDPAAWPGDVTVGTAKWAARWSADTNLIYLAATLEDNEHVFTTDYDAWNTRDAIEVYIDASNSDATPYAWGNPVEGGGEMRSAQQWVVGPDGSTGPDGDGYWQTLGAIAIPEGAVPDAAVSVDGATINYEIAMTPWESLVWAYDDDNTTVIGVDNENSTIVTLAPGVEMGLDVVLGSVYGTNFGMTAENTDPTKWNDAGQMLNVTLAEGTTEPLLGDVNLDGVVNGLDVDPFVGLVTAGGFQTEADMNGDGAVNGLDVDPFVAAVVGGGGAQAVPEPGTLLLALMAGLALIAVGRWK
jgi:hypothetical protein